MSHIYSFLIVIGVYSFAVLLFLFYRARVRRYEKDGVRK